MTFETDLMILATDPPWRGSFILSFARNEFGLTNPPLAGMSHLLIIALEAFIATIISTEFSTLSKKR